MSSATATLSRRTRNCVATQHSCSLTCRSLAATGASTQAEDEVQRALLLDVVIGERSAVLKLLTGKDEALLVRRDTCKKKKPSGLSTDPTFQSAHQHSKQLIRHTVLSTVPIWKEKSALPFNPTAHTANTKQQTNLLCPGFWP
jgi:hypothetical protein